MTSLPAESSPRSQLAHDPVRTLVAAVIALLSIGGWIYALTKPALRATLGSQTAIWWLEQGIILLQASACVALVRGVPRAWRPASILTGAALVITTLAWVQSMRVTGRHPIPVTPILNALLLWRLWRPTSLEASGRLAA